MKHNKQQNIVIIIILLSAFSIKSYSQKTGTLLIHLSTGIGITSSDNNGGYFPSLGNMNLTTLSIGKMFSTNVALSTGIGLSSYNYNLFYDRGDAGSQKVQYLELPFTLKVTNESSRKKDPYYFTANSDS
jgi:hypothetical protein